MKKLLATKLNLVIAILVLPTLALAGSGAGAHHGSIADLKWPWVNFSLYVLGMYFILRGTISKGWQARTARIKDEATRGERELEAATAALSAERERQTKLPTEKAPLTRALTTEGQAEATKTISDAEQRAADIEKQAANRIIAEQQAAINAIRRQVATKVINASERRVRSGISAESDKKIRQNTSRSISQLRAFSTKGYLS